MLGVSDTSMAEKMVEFKKELREKTIQKDKILLGLNITKEANIAAKGF